MFSKTTLSALRALACLGAESGVDRAPLSPRQIADRLGESPTYLAKVMRLLVRVGILRAQRGVHGGVVLHRQPCDISLLAVVEACQGAVLGQFCIDDPTLLSQACAFHHASAELHAAMVNVLGRWTLQDLLDRPGPKPGLAGHAPCWMQANPWRPAVARRAEPAESADEPPRRKRRAMRGPTATSKRARR